MTLMQAFDRLLAALVLALAAGSIAVRNRFLAIATFIAFSLNVALIWARLGALDVALAEAAALELSAASCCPAGVQLVRAPRPTGPSAMIEADVHREHGPVVQLAT